MIKVKELRKGDDLKELVDLSKSFFSEYQKHHEFFFHVGKFADKEIKNSFIRKLKEKNSKVFVAVEDSSIIGYIFCSVRERPPFYQIKKVGHISTLIVRQDYRIKGVATQLFKTAKKWFRQKGVKYFDLETSVRNKEAREFYGQLNMVPLRYHFLGEV